MRNHHFIGLTLVIGIAGFFDLRLMGFMKRVPVSAARELMPLAIAGFAMNMTTGAVFFIGTPHQYVGNVAWWAKVSCLVLAGLNAMFFETTVGARTMNLGAGDDTPTVRENRRRRVAGVVAGRSLLGPDAAVYRQCVLTESNDAR